MTARRGSPGTPEEGPSANGAKRVRRIGATLVWLAVGIGLGVLVARAWPGPFVPRQDAVVAGVSADAVRVDTADLGVWGGPAIVVEPASGRADTLLIFYPGGAVRPQAYTWLGVALAPTGVRTVIPSMPLDLAVLAPNRGDVVVDRYGSDASTVIVAGHSLGGAMAARWVARETPPVDAMVLMGAYPANDDDLSGAALDVLVLAGERDGLATLDEVRDGLTRLPSDTVLVTIPGSVHSFFGRYGPQDGDGLPTVTRAEAQQAIVERLRVFVAGVASGSAATE